MPLFSAHRPFSFINKTTECFKNKPRIPNLILRWLTAPKTLETTALRDDCYRCACYDSMTQTQNSTNIFQSPSHALPDILIPSPRLKQSFTWLKTKMWGNWIGLPSSGMWASQMGTLLPMLQDSVSAISSTLKMSKHNCSKWEVNEGWAQNILKLSSSRRLRHALCKELDGDAEQEQMSTASRKTFVCVVTTHWATHSLLNPIFTEIFREQRLKLLRTDGIFRAYEMEGLKPSPSLRDVYSVEARWATLLRGRALRITITHIKSSLYPDVILLPPAGWW